MCVHESIVSYLTVVQFYLVIWLAVVHFDVVKRSHRPSALWLRTLHENTATHTYIKTRAVKT